jgi:hypothetical protein
MTGVYVTVGVITVFGLLIWIAMSKAGAAERFRERVKQTDAARKIEARAGKILNGPRRVGTDLVDRLRAKRRHR